MDTVENIGITFYQTIITLFINTSNVTLMTFDFL
ncbi:hypothetical protein ATE84_2711 [Aquimarina sp. MAR_2010_214]|nr:hypothetical protein ATE84_2711 [Aquimarina sp. MAR_2010_214]